MSPAKRDEPASNEVDTAWERTSLWLNGEAWGELRREAVTYKVPATSLVAAMIDTFLAMPEAERKPVVERAKVIRQARRPTGRPASS